MRRWILAVLTCFWVCCAAAEGFPPSSEPTIAGIDVSAWQREIDWEQVADAGVKIAFIRATEGSRFVDPQFRRNYTGAKAHGVAVGFYHFMTAKTEAEAVAQADFFADTVANTQPECRMVLDYGGSAGLSGETMTRNALAFMERVQTRTGWGVMLYTDAWAAKARFGEALTAFPIWVANYGVKEPEANGKWASWAGFQYSDRGTIPGISGRVDLDWFTKEVYLSAAPSPSPTPTPVTDTEMQYRQIRTKTTLTRLAAAWDVSEDMLATLNPHLMEGILPGAVVRFPQGAKVDEAYGGWHIVQEKENMATVAAHYGASAAALRQMNALTTAEVGQCLRIPAVREGVQASPKHLLQQAVIVASGQTLASIAKAYGITEEELRTINGLSASTQVHRGQILQLAPFGNGETSGFRGGYVVNRGDTLDRIAGRFGTTAARLMQLNNIANANTLWPGQVLLLPAE